MNMHVIASTIDTLGTLMIATAALRVHHRFLNEHKVDDYVFRIMKLEQYVGITGMILVLIGFTLDTFFA